MALRYKAYLYFFSGHKANMAEPGKNGERILTNKSRMGFMKEMSSQRKPSKEQNSTHIISEALISNQTL